MTKTETKTIKAGAVITNGKTEGRVERINADGSVYLDCYDFDKTIPAADLAKWSIVGWDRR